MLCSQSKILVLAPHTDDGELGAGGSIARWANEGHQLHYVAFSACESSVPAPYPKDILRTEVRAATAELGIPDSQVRVLDFEVRHFGRDRQAVLQTMVDLNAEIKPDLVLLPALQDLHQDHEVIAKEGLRAFKRTCVLGYEIPWNDLTFASTLFVKLQPEDVQRKTTAIACYESQSGRSYANATYLESVLRFRGGQAGCEFAEAFEVLRWFV